MSVSFPPSVYRFCDPMRKPAVVILWGVAAAALLFLSPIQAELEVEIPHTIESSFASVESVPQNSTILSIVVDQFSSSDVVPQGDVILHSDADLTTDIEEEDDNYVDEEIEEDEDILLEERHFGNIRIPRSDDLKKKDNISQNRRYQSNKGQANHDNMQNPQGLRKKKVDAGTKRRQEQSRILDNVKIKSRKREKGKKSKPGQRRIRKKKIKAEGRGENETLPSENDGKSSRRKNKKRCRPKKLCKKRKGKCRHKCRKKEVAFKKGKCHGNQCTCCIHKKSTCKQKGNCVHQGTCRKSCLDTETHASYLPCKSSKCICCIPRADQVCKTSQECAKLKGTCKVSCSGEKVVAGMCKGPHCSCCVPAVSCASTASCHLSGGTCKSVCEDTEVLLPGTCSVGKNRCFCCGPEPTECSQTPICPGKCTPMCLGVVSLEAVCPGASCLCCLDCFPTQSCIDAHGKCKSICGCGEREVPNGCRGGGCKCCVADLPDCELKQTGCNSCMYTPLCKGDPPTLSCAIGGPGCSCCPP